MLALFPDQHLANHHGNIGDNAAACATPQERHHIDLRAQGTHLILSPGQLRNRRQRRTQFLFHFIAVITQRDMPIVADATSAIIKILGQLGGNKGMIGDSAWQFVGVGGPSGDCDLRLVDVKRATVLIKKILKSWA